MLRGLGIDAHAADRILGLRGEAPATARAMAGMRMVAGVAFTVMVMVRVVMVMRCRHRISPLQIP
jgi:hypothetical protein